MESEASSKVAVKHDGTTTEAIDTSAKAAQTSSKQPKTVADFLDEMRLQSNIIDKEVEETKNADGDAVISDKVLTAAEEEEE